MNRQMNPLLKEAGLAGSFVGAIVFSPGLGWETFGQMETERLFALLGFYTTLVAALFRGTAWTARQIAQRQGWIGADAEKTD
jgi:membrane protease YdiL (CAAX protease family)